MPCYTTAAVTAKAVIYKLLSLNCFVLFALNGLYWFSRKKIVTNVIRLCLFFTTVKRKVSCVLPKISWLLYKEIIAWPACSVFGNNTGGILDNFEISLVVSLPNTTTSRAITYTYWILLLVLLAIFRNITNAFGHA